ncbi:MAG TPA: hypothetical protein VHT96_09635 [Clostridia bacterium]|nr:hypothetical protein [Clostridia bacterium]
MFKLRTFLSSCLVLALFVTLSSFSSAENSGGIEVTQTKIIFAADRDEGKTVQFEVRNTSEQEYDLKIEKADFYINDFGGFQIVEAGSTPSSACNFIECRESKMIVKPGDDLTFDVTLKQGMKYILPEYTATILVRYIPKSELDGDSNIKTYTQVAIITRVLSGSLLKGEIDTSKPPLQFVDITGSRLMGYGGKKEIKFALKNIGLLTVEPKIEADVNSVFSGQVEEISDIRGYIMPEQTRTYSVPVSSSSVFDVRTINIEYKYDYAGKSFNDKCSFTYLVLSYQLVIGLLLLIAGIIWQTRLFRKRNKLLKQLLEQNKALAEAAAASTSVIGTEPQETDDTAGDKPQK